MFDPTIYENLKVVIEGEIYDRDLNGEIAIIDRQDCVNLATMSRFYKISFQLLGSDPDFKATIQLNAEADDLFGEILEHVQHPGCFLVLYIHGPIIMMEKTIPILHETLTSLWGKRPTITHEITYDWNFTQKNQYQLKTTLHFDRKINESHISDFPEIITLLQQSLEIAEKINDNP